MQAYFSPSVLLKKDQPENKASCSISELGNYHCEVLMHSNGDAYYVLQQYNYGGCMYTACSIQCLIMMCHYDWGIVGKKWGYGKVHQQHKTQSL